LALRWNGKNKPVSIRSFVFHVKRLIDFGSNVLGQLPSKAPAIGAEGKRRRSVEIGIGI